MATRRPIPIKPTPRRDRREIPSAATTLVFCLFMVALLIVSAWWGLSHLLPTEADRRPERIVTHETLAPTYTYNGEVIRWYVLVDPDTSVQYLVNDRGGCCPRLDQYGNVIGVQTWNEYD